MPRTIEEGFRDFLSKLTATATITEAAKRHRASIEGCLKSSFNLQTIFRSGSFGNGTNISGFSDVDYFAVIPADALSQNSTYSLQKIRMALDARFPSTGVCVDCPAVCVPFGQTASEDTEIVPAYYIKEENNFRVFGIPDCNGGWNAELALTLTMHTCHMLMARKATKSNR